MSGILSRISAPPYTLLNSTSSPLTTVTEAPLAPAYDTSSLFTTDEGDYKTLQVANALDLDFLLSRPPRPTDSYSDIKTPIFYVKISPQDETDIAVTLRDKNADGAILGFVKMLRWSRPHVFGLGEFEVVWEELRRASPLTHSRYEFEYDFGRQAGGRCKFIWRRQGPRLFFDQPGLELHQIVGWGAWGAQGYESPEILATYRGMRWGYWKRDGRLRIKPRITANGSTESRESGEKEEQWGEWEQVVTLTAIGILEGTRRRRA